MAGINGAWDSTSSHFYFTLSNGDRTATSSAQGGIVAATDVQDAGTLALLYCEITPSAVGAKPRIGISDVVYEWSGKYLQPNGQVFYAESGSLTPVYPHLVYSAGSVIRFAYRRLENRIWISVNGGPWNAGGTANPVTNVGGYENDYLDGATKFAPFISEQSPGGGTIATINTGTVAFAYPIPSGFVGWYGTAAPAGKTMKVWGGSAWVAKPTKVWSGSAWVTKPIKTWNGSSWT